MMGYCDIINFSSECKRLGNIEELQNHYHHQTPTQGEKG